MKTNLIFHTLGELLVLLTLVCTACFYYVEMPGKRSTKLQHRVCVVKQRSWLTVLTIDPSIAFKANVDGGRAALNQEKSLGKLFKILKEGKP